MLGHVASVCHTMRCYIVMDWGIEPKIVGIPDNNPCGMGQLEDNPCGMGQPEDNPCGMGQPVDNPCGMGQPEELMNNGEEQTVD